MIGHWIRIAFLMGTARNWVQNFCKLAWEIMKSVVSSTVCLKTGNGRAKETLGFSENRRRKGKDPWLASQ
jgi:hypothetical protein